MKRSIGRYTLPLALALVAFAFFLGARFASVINNGPVSGSEIRHSAASRSASQPAQTLVVYIFSKTDTQYENNLMFFLQHGIAENDGCDYIFILQDIQGVPTPDISAKIPSNARVEHHPNGCYDWGTIGWLLKNRNVDTAKYKYFIFMNSSVRGPFIPAYAKGGGKRWHEHITDRINDKVKLVGPTISCEGSPFEGNVAGEWRTNPHVQSYVLGTDQVGLKLWLDDGKVFGCYDSMWDTIYHSELGSSLAILNGGYNLESFMLRYQGIDWQDKANWGCNNSTNPYGENYYDGISLAPYEVMFVKVKGMLLANDWSYARVAKKYGEWMTQQATKGVAEIASNVWKSNPWPLKAAKLAYARARGSKCFDAKYYQSHNKDLKHIQGAAQLWEHYVTSGQFEGRPFRFNCEDKMQ